MIFERPVSNNWDCHRKLSKNAINKISSFDSGCTGTIRTGHNCGVPFLAGHGGMDTPRSYRTRHSGWVVPMRMTGLPYKDDDDDDENGNDK
eukprot:scaffold15131_cov174-Amphora_coffeaeformis.AAC.4